MEESLPAWGVWIEMVKGRYDGKRKYGRSPHGECGLKLAVIAGLTRYPASLPAWGVWIEILCVDVAISKPNASLPAWGVWIEMKRSAG